MALQFGRIEDTFGVHQHARKVLSSASRLLTFVLPLVLISRLPGFALHHVWWLSVGTTTLQALFSLWLLRREFHLKLRPAGAQPDVMLSTATK